jgi:leucyl aminopeptidase
MVRPATLEKYAKEIAAQHKSVKCKVFSFAEAKAKGFGGFCAVAQGSEEPARFIVLEYWGGTGKDAVALVGKGITFDSGGISIKPSAGMGEMKTDMSGAATTLSAFQALVALGVKKNILCLVPSTENMPSGKAYKPGDIITTYNGRTVEINSTDAEGRMILCDALTYAQELGATKIIDYATLTGACLVALGQTRAGVMTNNQSFCDEYMDASEKVGEKHWQLPMDEEYEELLKSDVADTLNNAEKRYAGTISAAKFLEKFIDKGNEWIHCDIAGTAFLDKSQRYIDKMATGFGIRTLVEWLS